jgi:hypothetical protein
MTTAVQRKPGAGQLWPRALNLPASWVVKAMFLAIRFRLTEVGVPPGAALLEKLASLAPGVPDAVLHWATSSRIRPATTRKPSKAARGRSRGRRR